MVPTSADLKFKVSLGSKQMCASLDYKARTCLKKQKHQKTQTVPVSLHCPPPRDHGEEMTNKTKLDSVLALRGSQQGVEEQGVGAGGLET